MYKKRAQGWAKHLDFMLIDILCLLGSYLLAYIIRHRVHPQTYWRDTYLVMLFVLPILDAALILITNFFKNVLRRSRAREFFLTLRQSLIIVMMATFYLFIIQNGFWFSRLMMFYMALLYLGSSYLARLAWKDHLIRTNGGRSKRSLLIVTFKEMAPDVLDRILFKKYEAYKVTGLAFLDADAIGETTGGIPVVASRETLLDYICYEWVDEVFVNLPNGEPYPKDLEEKIVEMGVPVHRKLVTSRKTEGVEQIVSSLGNYTVLTTSMNVISTWQIVIKRLMDILIGLVGCILTALLFVILGPMIRLKAHASVIFVQERVGRNGKKFGLYKFRTMYPDAEKRKNELTRQNKVKDGRMFKLDEDPRVIGSRILPDGTYKKGIGNWIRDFSLDEFPQFVNVLRGDMSVVGTRPPTLEEWNKYEYHHRARLAIKPGITGMWQVNGRSTITDFEKVVELDRYYIEHYSTLLDLAIILKTIKVVFKRDGAA